jgi:ankyrin repeat protein
MGHAGLLRNLLAEGADPNQRSDAPFLCTALKHAARKGSLDMIQCLLAHGADPNLATPNGGTPLLSVADNNRMELMETLVKAGARTDATYTKFDTVDSLMIAARFGAWDGVKFLLKHGCKINRQSRHGVTALHFAMLSKDQPKLVEKLLRLGADPWLKTQKGYTPLDYAVRCGRVRAAAILRRAMAKPKARQSGKRHRNTRK